ncbi:MAG: TIGR01459 family HAD-type hydrolase [Alphaproteobacteria bacterium]|nr:TIGR01459 family HAD-type hydrolase [Alphaproteobacteria bacterium]
MLPIHDGLSGIADRYDHFIIDVWGVLHDGVKAYQGAADAMRFLADKGKQNLLLSNSPNRSSRVVEKVIGPIGIPHDTYKHILTSGEAAWAHMRTHHAGQKVYTFWDDENPTALDNLGVTRVYDVREADFIYGSLVPYDAVELQYADVLAIALAHKIPFVCGNPDRVVGHGDSLHLCVGTLAEWYEKNGGAVTWIGKPYRPIYDQAWEMLGKPDKSRILAIGDSLVTDVAGASTFGCDVLWNVTGIHWEELKSDHAANTIDPAKVTVAVKGHARPTGLLHGFRV